VWRVVRGCALFALALVIFLAVWIWWGSRPRIKDEHTEIARISDGVTVWNETCLKIDPFDLDPIRVNRYFVQLPGHDREELPGNEDAGGLLAGAPPYFVRTPRGPVVVIKSRAFLRSKDGWEPFEIARESLRSFLFRCPDLWTAMESRPDVYERMRYTLPATPLIDSLAIAGRRMELGIHLPGGVTPRLVYRQAAPWAYMLFPGAFDLEASAASSAPFCRARARDLLVDLAVVRSLSGLNDRTLAARVQETQSLQGLDVITQSTHQLSARATRVDVTLPGNPELSFQYELAAAAGSRNVMLAYESFSDDALELPLERWNLLEVRALSAGPGAPTWHVFVRPRSSG
jgi:hypothetical protein